ncbi:unnamed protein product, partial [Didymodactylos carnosus]
QTTEPTPNSSKGDDQQQQGSDDENEYVAPIDFTSKLILLNIADLFTLRSQEGSKKYLLTLL